MKRTPSLLLCSLLSISLVFGLSVPAYAQTGYSDSDSNNESVPVLDDEASDGPHAIQNTPSEEQATEGADELTGDTERPDAAFPDIAAQETAPTSQPADDGSTAAVQQRYDVSTGEELQDAIRAINEAPEGSYTIALAGDISTDLVDPDGAFELTKNEVTLLGQGHALTFSSQTADYGGTGNNLSIDGGSAVLNLGSPDGLDVLIISGPGEEASAREDTLLDIDSGTVNMYDGVVLKDNWRKNGARPGMAVALYADNPDQGDCVFNMYGGSIEHNSQPFYLAGAVSVRGQEDVSAVFNMYGGQVRDNVCSDANNGCGGGVLLLGGTFNMSGGEISGNNAHYGGGIGVARDFSAKDVSTVAISGGSVSGNIGVQGAGVYAQNVDMNLANCSVSGNSGASWGGGIYVASESSVSLEGSSVDNNQSQYGAGIYVAADRSVSLNGCSVDANESTLGGGIYIGKRASASVRSTLLAENTASNSGGGAYVAENGTMTLDDSDIEGNTANQGGGLYALNSNAKCILQESDVTGNAATSLGGGIMGQSGGLVQLSGGSVTGNNAKSAGGGVYMWGEGSVASIEGTVVANNSADYMGSDLMCKSGGSFSMLPDAASMGAIYEADGLGKAVDGWYDDYHQDNRYTPSSDGVPVDVSSGLNGDAALVASYRVESVEPVEPGGSDGGNSVNSAVSQGEADEGNLPATGDRMLFTACLIAALAAAAALAGCVAHRFVSRAARIRQR